MKISVIFALVCLTVVLARPLSRTKFEEYSYHVGQSQKMFKSETATSSKAVYDLIERNPDNVYLFAFYIRGKDHEDVVANVESSLAGLKDVMDQITYVGVDASDDYQFKGILYDLAILDQSWVEYPYFLVIKDENGHLVNGPKSKDIIREKILSLTGKGSATSK